MRIDELTVTNFRGFAHQHFEFPHQFHLIVGENGSGKTSALDALAVAMGSWLLGIPGYDARSIRDDDIRTVVTFERRRFEVNRQVPVEVRAVGSVTDHDRVVWRRVLSGEDGRTSRTHAGPIARLARLAAGHVRDGRDVTLPVLSYYGAGRLWQPLGEKRADGRSARSLAGVSPQDLPPDTEADHAVRFASRLAGYHHSVDPRCSPNELLRWMRLQRHFELDEEIESPPFRLVLRAIQNCLHVDGLRYSIRHGTLVAELPGHVLTPFAALSDGYRNVVAMVGDIAHKCATLNPHLADSALSKTPGIVLIDEIDLHLHPRWQRVVVDDLRRTFPAIQFIATSHSPFVVQTLQEGELIQLDDRVVGAYANAGLEAVAMNVLGITEPNVTPRYIAMLDAARQYFAALDTVPAAGSTERDDLKARLDELARPYADNAAYQAFLEMQRVRAFRE